MPVTTPSFPRALAVTAVLGLALAAPAYAATSASSGSTSAAPAGQSATSTAKHRSSKSMEDKVEARIKTLHDKLGITPDQESQWNDVAQAMRDNEANMKSLIEDRHSNAQTMTAVEDLMSYQKIAQAHADGLNKVETAFEPLYDSMNDSQKKNADEVFGRFEGHRGAPVASDMSAGSKGKKTASTPDSNQ